MCSKCGEAYGPDVIFCPKDGTPLGSKKTEVVDDPYVGICLAGQFSIEQLVGIGAMGRVYRAHQSGIDRDVAVKILHRELMMNAGLISRFHREAKVASRLVHPNVVQVLMTGDVDRMTDGDIGGEAYLAMEYLDGISLHSALGAAGGSLPLPRALHVVLQVCDAVGEAHAQNIVHRDLKPENVMLVRRGDDPDFVKVLDFGVARMDWADSSVATQAGVIFGTARYISPEGAQGNQVTPRSDAYSIATMLFQCLAGRTPFDAENPVAILVKQTSEPAPPLRSIERASYVPEPLAKVIEENLAKNPEHRASDARAFGRAIVEAARDSGLSPDDLLSSSTLLGGGRALQLQSIARTRSLNLTDALADKMRGDTAAGDSVPTATDDEKRDTKTARDTRGPGGTRVIDSPAPTKPESSVDPTLADEPADEVRRASTPPSRPRASRPPRSSRPPPSSPAPASHAPPSSPSPHSSPAPPSGRPSALSLPPVPTRGPSRVAFIAGSFVFGAAISVAIAFALGAFERDDRPTPATYANRAKAAMAASAWDDPPGENVKDLTETALRRWPGAEPILAVRRDAATRLTDRAETLRATEEEEAIHMAELAVDLDPSSQRARALLRSLRVASTPSPPVGTDAGRTAEPEAAPSPKLGARKSAVPTKTPRIAPPADAGVAPEPAEKKPGGRWL